MNTWYLLIGIVVVVFVALFVMSRASASDPTTGVQKPPRRVPARDPLAPTHTIAGGVTGGALDIGEIWS